MKNFKDVWEDAAANSVAAGGISMPADMMPKDKHDKHKKRAKATYDARTKEGKAFIERILARRKAAEEKRSKINASRNLDSIRTKKSD